MSNLTDLRITARTLPRYVREAAADSGKVVFLPPHDKRAMAGMMRLQQQLKCLREGVIVGAITRDKHDAFVFSMERYAAHQLCQIRVRAFCKGAEVVQLIVSPRRPTHV